MGQLELIHRVELPKAARRISATFCPRLHASEPEYIVAGGEDTHVYVYDISRPTSKPVVVNQLQVCLCKAPHMDEDSDMQGSNMVVLSRSFIGTPDSVYIICKHRQSRCLPLKHTAKVQAFALFRHMFVATRRYMVHTHQKHCATALLHQC